MKHSTIFIQHNSWAANIDELIAPLIMILWNNNINTCFSCQEDIYWDDECNAYRSMAHIQFDEYKEASKFMNLVVEKFKKLNPKHDPEDINPYPFFDWKYEIYPQWNNETNKTWFMTTINFPTKDISLIIKVLNDEQLSKQELKNLAKMF